MHTSWERPGRHTADADTLGNNLGDDLAEGKPTLPLIRTLEVGSENQKAVVRRAIQNKTAEELEAVVAAVQDCGALDYASDMARRYHDLAMNNLDSLPQGQHRQALADIAALSINRDH